MERGEKRAWSYTGREEWGATGWMFLACVCVFVRGPVQTGSLCGRASGETHTHTHTHTLRP